MEVLSFSIGYKCDETLTKTALFVNSDDEEFPAISKVLSVTFILGETLGATVTLCPFIHRINCLEPTDVKFILALEDGSTHTFRHRVLLEPGIHATRVSCNFNPDLDKKSVKSLFLTDRPFHLELDLQVPYPHSRWSYCHPKNIAHALEVRSEMRCIFTGFYTEECHPEGGHQIPACNFSGTGLHARPYVDCATGMQEQGRKGEAMGPRGTGSPGKKKAPLSDGAPWKLAYDAGDPVNISGSGQSTNLILISPPMRGHAGLDMILCMMLTIAAADSEVHLKHRPGFRICISVLDLRLAQIVKLAQQYFKFEDVIDSLICDPLSEDSSIATMEADVAQTVHRNGSDVKVRNRETTLYRENAVHEVTRKRVNMHRLLGECTTLEDLIQVACPHQSRRYRFSLSHLRRRGFVEFRIEKNQTRYHFISCYIQLLLRLVEESANNPPPKMFKKNGLGKYAQYREDKFFYWLIKDRYLRDELLEMRRQAAMGEIMDDDIAATLRLMAKISRQSGKAASQPVGQVLSLAEQRVETRRRGLSAKFSKPATIGDRDIHDCFASTTMHSISDFLRTDLQPESPRGGASSGVRSMVTSNVSRSSRFRAQMASGEKVTKSVGFSSC